MTDTEKQQTQEPTTFAQEWNLVPKLLFLTLNLMMYAIHAMETSYYVGELNFKEYEVGFLSALQLIPFGVSLLLSNVADAHHAHREMTIYLTACFCLVNSLSSIKALTAGNIVAMMVLKTLSSTCAGAVFPFVDAMVVSMLAQRGAFSKDSFGSQRMFGSLGHLFATSLSFRFNFYLVSHDAMFFLLNTAGLLFMLVVLLGTPADLKIEKGGGHHHHHAPKTTSPGGHLSPAASAASESPTRTPSPSPMTGEQNAEACLKVAETVQLQTSSTPAPPPIHLGGTSPVFRLLASVEFLAFLAFILTAGYSRSIMNIFQKHYIISVLGMPDNNLDFMEFFRTGSEMIIYYSSKHVISALGPHWVLLLSQASGLVRILIYSYYGTWFKDNKSDYVWYIQTATIVFAELMKGLNTGMMMSCAIKVANEMAPSGCEGTAQSLLSGSYNALGLTVGGIFSGLVIYWNYESGAQDALEKMFTYSAVISALFIIAFFLKFAFVDKALWKSK